MDKEVKKYLKVIVPAILLNLAAAFIYDVSKEIIASDNYRFPIFVFGLVVINLIYSFILIKFVKRIERDKFVERTSIHHSFAHNARNIAVKLMPGKTPISPLNKVDERPAPLTGDLHYMYQGDIVVLLRSMADMFSKLAPEGTNVWACLRERRTDDHYHTILRAGLFEPTRAEFSTPLSKDSKTIQNLKYSYEHKMDCVLITGSNRQDQGWEKMRNDEFREDLSVLMGAVLSKSWNGQEFVDPMLNWVLCICANKENVFNETHIPLMKCCNDIFSWLLNSFIRGGDNSSGSIMRFSKVR